MRVRSVSAIILCYLTVLIYTAGEAWRKPEHQTRGLRRIYKALQEGGVESPQLSTLYMLRERRGSGVGANTRNIAGYIVPDSTEHETWKFHAISRGLGYPRETTGVQTLHGAQCFPINTPWVYQDSSHLYKWYGPLQAGLMQEHITVMCNDLVAGKYKTYDRLFRNCKQLSRNIYVLCAHNPTEAGQSPYEPSTGDCPHP